MSDEIKKDASAPAPEEKKEEVVVEEKKEAEAEEKKPADAEAKVDKEETKDVEEGTSMHTSAEVPAKFKKIVEEIESKTEKIKKPIHVAIMGCAVNGPGESKKADIGIVGGPSGTNLLYKDGKIVGKIEKDNIVETVLKEIDVLNNRN